MNIRPLGAELYHVDGRTDGPTDMTMLIVAFRSFVGAPNNILKHAVEWSKNFSHC